MESIEYAKLRRVMRRLPQDDANASSASAEAGCVPISDRKYPRLPPTESAAAAPRSPPRITLDASHSSATAPRAPRMRDGRDTVEEKMAMAAQMGLTGWRTAQHRSVSRARRARSLMRVHLCVGRAGGRRRGGSSIPPASPTPFVGVESVSAIDPAHFHGHVPLA